MSEEARMAAIDGPTIAQQAARIAELERELTAARMVISTLEEVLAREVSMSALRIAFAQYQEKVKPHAD